MDYAILATLWNGPATLHELAAAVSDRTGRPVTTSLVDSYLRLFERCGFIERSNSESPYTLAERGSVYLAYAATA
jgi:DNA-binding PadR family transcriptional regulator